jgi:F-type H+-transporting ATPase subunit epsilon
MADTVRLEVVTPDREVLGVDTEEVVSLPGGDGLFGVLPGHCAFMTTLTPGIVAYLKDPEHDAGLAISGGFAVVQDDKITVLAEGAELPEEIDLEAARRELADAQAALPLAAAGEAEAAARDRVALNEGRIEAVAKWR